MSQLRERLAARYPRQVACSFCGRTLTIALKAKAVTTVTTGHAADCCMRLDHV